MIRKIKYLLGLLAYSILFGWLPHYQIGLRWPLSNACRRWCAHLILSSYGKRIDIGRKVKFSSEIHLGNRSSIGDYAYFQGKVHIRNDVMIAPRCAFLADNHVFSDVNRPMNTQGSIKGEITVCDNVWIGYGAIIVSGCTIGEGSICAAGSVITKDVEPYSIVGGNPARVIKKR